MPWRPDDEALLQRLEDEELLERVFSAVTGQGPSQVGDPSHEGRAPTLHARASGLIAELRKVPGALSEAVQASIVGDITPLVRVIAGLGDSTRIDLTSAAPTHTPELVHHVALFHAAAARALEHQAPESAATAWVRSLGAWMALAKEKTYLTKLEASVLGSSKRRQGHEEKLEIPPDDVPLEIIAEIARRADDAARDLTAPGKAALLALARIEEAARITDASTDIARRARIFADRRRNAAIEAALAVISEGLEEAGVRGELSASGGTLLERAIAVWSWTGHDEHVEQFVVDRIEKIGWQLYRARSWDELHKLLAPFRPMFESLASRIERDPTQISYAAGCAQMFVFIAEVEKNLDDKITIAERALRICPTHRNGRLVLASFLCSRAMEALRLFSVLTPTKELERVEALVARAEELYPQSSELPETKKALERAKQGFRVLKS